MDYLIYNLADPTLHPLANASLLSADERARADKRGGSAAERYILTRCLLRLELARRLGGAPQHIRFRHSAQGKPHCEGLEFNLSHSGDYLAIAFDTAPIGIDIERIRPRAHMTALAARIMCPEQLAAFRERACPASEFYACWCATEALVKQAAASIWQAADFPCIYEHGRIRLLTQQEDAPSVTLFNPAPGYQGAVASFPPRLHT